MATILVVDDDPVALQTVREMFADTAHTLLEASDWTGLRDHLFGDRIAVVVMDVQMPGTSGDVLADIIRRNLDPRPRILLHSVLPEEELRRLARKVQAEGSIPKGTGRRRLVDAVEAAVRAYEREYFETEDPTLTDPAPDRRTPRRRVLVVEDMNTRRYWLGEWLQERSILPVTAPNGAVALKVLGELPDQDLPELVISDLHMPRMDGGQLMDALRESSRYREIEAVLYSTSLADAETYADGERAHLHDLSLGAIGFDELLVLLETRYGSTASASARGH